MEQNQNQSCNQEETQSCNRNQEETQSCNQEETQEEETMVEKYTQLKVDNDNDVVNTDLLSAIKNFMDDLSNITTAQNFMDYSTIVNHIDETKVKSYVKLVSGFKVFFEKNIEALTTGKVEAISDPNISYVTDNGSFSFNFLKIYEETDEHHQDVIKDHLNHIWSILNDMGKTREEMYIDKVFDDLKARFSPELSREEQMMIAKDLFSDFQKQNLDISIVIKVACQKARKLLLSNGSEDHSKTLVLLDTVEEIDVNNFNIVQFMALVGKMGSLFADDENNPLSDLLANVFAHNLPSQLNDA